MARQKRKVVSWEEKSVSFIFYEYTWIVLILQNLVTATQSKKSDKKKTNTEKKPSTSTMRLRSSKTSTGPDPAEGSSPVVTPDPATTSSANPSSSDLLTNSIVGASDKLQGILKNNSLELKLFFLRYILLISVKCKYSSLLILFSSRCVSHFV